MRVYVVLEEDRGCGASVVGVFASIERALEFIENEGRSGYYLDSRDGTEVKE